MVCDGHKLHVYNRINGRTIKLADIIEQPNTGCTVGTWCKVSSSSTLGYFKTVGQIDAIAINYSGGTNNCTNPVTNCECIIIYGTTWTDAEIDAAINILPMEDATIVKNESNKWLYVGIAAIGLTVIYLATKK